MSAQGFDKPSRNFTVAPGTHCQDVVPVICATIGTLKNPVCIKQFVLVFATKIAYAIKAFTTLLNGWFPWHVSLIASTSERKYIPRTNSKGEQVS
jgi:hypothetical protein